MPYAIRAIELDAYYSQPQEMDAAADHNDA